MSDAGFSDHALRGLGQNHVAVSRIEIYMELYIPFKTYMALYIRILEANCSRNILRTHNRQ